jgi:hypothetical protein
MANLNWTVAENALLGQNIEEVASTAKQSLGSIVRAKHATYGQGEFIYLLGVTSTAAGAMVTYSPSTYQTALSPNTANTGQPVAVATAATTPTQKYGWYQISGKAVVLKTAVAVSPSVALFQSATTGRVMSTTASGKQLLNARSANTASVTSTTSTVLVQINRPFIQGRIL